MAFPELYTVAQLAADFRMKPDTIRRRLADTPHEMKGKRRVYRLDVAAAAILGVDSEKLDPNHEIARHNAARADAQELRNAQARRELAPVGLLEAALTVLAVEVGSILDEIPIRLRRANPALRSSDIDDVSRAIAQARERAATITIDFDALTS